MSRNLVFSSVGDCSAHRHWLSKGHRAFDLILYYYGSERNDYTGDAEVLVRRPGTKTQNFVHLYRTRPRLIEGYDSVFIVDDDVIMDTPTIHAMFGLFERYGLWLAQPAYAPGSDIRWPTTSQDPTALLRYTNFVEVGVTLWSCTALSRVVDVMDSSPSGWGLDMLFSQLLGDPEDKIAILDASPCVHPSRKIREMDTVMTRAAMKEEGLELLGRHRGGSYLEPVIYRRVPL